ncbi:uncharacterized protein LOC119796450 [Cyprinodon tularosa]|uniref:uncharacterized protein LOC119796450 n=1 Tax=Cyprinodon tularosa TaxID=77115 RepID=UPI0018E22DCF|nr:uncharacterized protein LOC119796450 [Cyprinodon tularosa]
MGHTRWSNFLFSLTIGVCVLVLHQVASESAKLEFPKCYGLIGNDSKNCDKGSDFYRAQAHCSKSNCGTALKPEEKLTSKSPSPCTGFNSEYHCQYNDTNGCKLVFAVCSAALPQPTISLTLPNGKLVESGVAEIPGDSILSFKCSVNSTLNSINFFLIYNRSILNKSNPITGLASVDFPVPEHKGNYSCMYQVNLNGTYKSKETETINVLFTEPWWNMLPYILPAGILMLLLMVFLVVGLVCRRRRRAKEPIPVVLNQITIRNSYAEDEDEDDGEMDYVNVEKMVNKSQGARNGGEKDGGAHCYKTSRLDYASKERKQQKRQDNTSDDEHDYEEADQGCAAAKSNVKKQRHQEDSDDEHDYEEADKGCAAAKSNVKKQRHQEDSDDEHDYEVADNRSPASESDSETESDEEESSDEDHNYVNLAEENVATNLDESNIYQNT